MYVTNYMLIKLCTYFFIECTDSGISNCDFCDSVADGCTQCAAGYGYFDRDTCSSTYLLNLYYQTVTYRIHLPLLALLYIIMLLY